MRVMLVALVAMLTACTALPEAPAQYISNAAEAGRFVEIERIAAEDLSDLRITIWLPPGYDSGQRQYPVLYMLDGHNLFFPERASFGKVWHADKAMLQVIKEGIEPHIIVGIWASGEDRYRQYLPRDFYDSSHGALRTAMDDTSKGEIVSDKYLEWLGSGLKPMIDHQYRTKPGAINTAIAGSSMGGLMSCYAFLQRPDIFGRAACISSHWPAADPAKTGSEHAALAALWTSWFKTSLGRPAGRKLWMDHGTATLDQFYASYQERLDMEVTRLGWKKGLDFESKIFVGAEHDENAWAARMPQMLSWLLAK